MSKDDSTAKAGVEAMLCLLNKADPEARYLDICMVISACETRSTYFAEHFAPLNALIAVGRADPELIDRLASKLGLRRHTEEPQECEGPESGRNEYQRGYMRARRERLAKALSLETARRPEISPEAKVDIQTQIVGRWREERAAFLASKGELSWKERNRASAEFWANVDLALNERLIPSLDELDSSRFGWRIERPRHGWRVAKGHGGGPPGA